MTTTQNLKAGVMGWPIHHSLSPRLHGFWLDRYGIDGSYEAFAVEPDHLPATLRGLKARGISGVNLTIPHKVAACAIVDELDPAAKRIGAINLVTVDDNGRLLGRNTDAYGFEQNLLAAGFKKQNGVAFVLGAGGAARAVLVALETMGFTEIRLANRTLDKAEKLARDLSTPDCAISVVGWENASQGLANVELLVNATSLGMDGQPPLDFPLENLPKDAWVTDIVYTPLKTALLDQANMRGNKIVDGLGMLLHQARPAFQAFFGVDPEVDAALREHVLAGRS
ncbi:MAG: shikimate dehydrogenase [Alphaproteobacteria bacterium]|nr:shikimate dehydrogenase [Alphaproteobacteria bacterium]